MPYLSIQTNVMMDDAGQEALLEKTSKTVASILEKPESYVMVSLNSASAMRFAGTDAPMAYLQLKSLGLPEAQTGAFSQALCELMQAELGIDSGRVYIEFSGPERHMWGWNRSTF